MGKINLQVDLATHPATGEHKVTVKGMICNASLSQIQPTSVEKPAPLGSWKGPKRNGEGGWDFLFSFAGIQFCFLIVQSQGVVAGRPLKMAAA